MNAQHTSIAKRRRPSWIDRLAICAVLAGAVVLNQSAIHWRANVVDSHLFEFYGWCIAEGAVPYVDVWDNKPPGVWWVNAAAFALLGPGVAPSVVVSVLALVTALAAFVALVRRAFRVSLTWPAVLVGVALLADQRFECGANRTETFVLASETLAMLCYAVWLRRGRGSGLLWAGLFGGIAPVFKQSGVAAVAAIGLHLVYLRWRGARPGGRAAPRASAFVTLGCGFAIAPAVAAAVLASQGALDDAWFAVSTFNRAYFAVDDATWVRMDRAWTHFAPAVELLTPVAILAGVGLVAGAVGRIRGFLPSPGPLPEREGGSDPSPSRFPGREGSSRRALLSRARGGRPRRGVGAFVLWWVLAVYLAAVGPGRREYHLMPSLAPLGLLVLYGLHQLAGRRDLWRAITGSPVRAVGVVVWGYVLIVFMGGSLGELPKAWSLKPAWWSLERTVPAAYEAQAEVVAALTRPDERIYVSGWSPGTYRFAYRRVASRFATFEKVGQVGRHAQFIVDGARRDLRAAPPKVFVISIDDFAGVQQDAGSDWGQWLSTYYVQQSVVQGMRILVRRDEPPSFGQPPAAPLASPR